MRHIFTISIDTELEKQIDEYQKAMNFQTRSEGAIQLLKKGLKYDSYAEESKKEIGRLQEDLKKLKNKPNQIHLPCSVCGKPMTIFEANDDPIYKSMKTEFKNWGHSSCIEKNDEKI